MGGAQNRFTKAVTKKQVRPGQDAPLVIGEGVDLSIPRKHQEEVGNHFESGLPFVLVQWGERLEETSYSGTQV